MKILRTICLIVFLGLVGLIPACRSTAPVASNRPTAPAEVMDHSYLHEIVGYLCRWQLDESEVENLLAEKKFIFWVRPLEPKLDAGDHSQFAEILLPQLDMSVEVKKSDYAIEETGEVVKSRNFKITRILRGDIPHRPPQGCTVVMTDMQEFTDYLDRTRDSHEDPDAALVQHLREAVHKEAAEEGILDTNLPAGEQMIYIASLSPVANETWVYWEGGRKLFYIASDVDLGDPSVWKYEDMTVHIYDLDQQVVYSHEEDPGSNRFLTRYEVSRALFNCIILGDQVIIPPYPPSKSPPGATK